MSIEDLAEDIRLIEMIAGKAGDDFAGLSTRFSVYLERVRREPANTVHQIAGQHRIPPRRLAQLFGRYLHLSGSTSVLEVELQHLFRNRAL